MIELKEVSKVFQAPTGPVTAVEAVSLCVEAGETLCLIGTSGSGKTTCMKMINRLVEPSSGTIEVGGKDVRKLDPIALRRGIGYVIQKAGLMPHMTVARNVGLLCHLEGWPRQKTQERVKYLLSLVNLEPNEYLSRYPGELSGGQQQRVGVARALALDPDYILMDEPFGALDPITREGIHDEFLRLKSEVKKTIVMVTHDLPEAFKLGDRIALMDAGRLLQVGSEDDFMTRPASDFVSEFVKSHAVDGPPRVTVSAALEEDASTASDLPEVSPHASVKEALLRLEDGSSKHLAVVDDEGRRLGVVSARSLLKVLP